jgi:hypothetical protein
MRTRLKYLGDPQRTSIDETIAVDRRAYGCVIKHLESFAFWDRRDGIHPLWDHQKSAIVLCVAYLNADRVISEEGNVTEAALLKLPTGTGKSGIVAALTRCVPKVKRILVLTPRIALTDQLKKDIQSLLSG